MPDLNPESCILYPEMFIPRGSILHENLATSYVLVDSLVADLCEGGFSGVVEITLRRADARVVIVGGCVAASLMAQHGETADAQPRYSPSRVAEVAAAARGERGCLSIYRYSAETAEAIAGRASAEPLYTRLSTEFADLEKVITKLSRESHRQWFIEIDLANGLAALVHIKPDRCRVLTARDGALREACESDTVAENGALAALLDESHQLGGVFDVYFRSAESSADAGRPEDFSKESYKEASAAGDVTEVVKEAKAVFQSLSLDDATAAPVNQMTTPRTLPVSPETATALRELTRSLGEAPANGGAANQVEGGDAHDSPAEEPIALPPRPPDQISHPTFFRTVVDITQRTTADNEATVDEERPPAVIDYEPRSTSDLLLRPDDLRATGLLKRGSRADALAEIKRLMSEIVRTAEESIRAAGSRDSFTMHLRAGQLKVAEHYAFLDPFGGEFEYMAGEIVFVGDVSANDFVVGLSEALAHAIDNAARASAQPDRVRLHVAEGLRWLLNRERAELELYQLDQAIEAIISEAGAKG